MKTSTKEYFEYDEIVSLACHIWQEEGCPFGRYHTCWQQAKSQLLIARPNRNGKAGRRGHRA